MEELFKSEKIRDGGGNLRPLAFRMRPSTLEDFVGQEELLGEGRQLRLMIDSKSIYSLIFSGPPGTGKTALANIISTSLEAEIVRLNAVNAGVKDIRSAADRGRKNIARGVKTVLILDEIHRFSRNQQESLLPDVEEGNLTLIGLTTENPYYFISGPLLSRTTVYSFKPLPVEDIISILRRASDYLEGISSVSDDALRIIAGSAEGDARYAINMLESSALATSKSLLSAEDVKRSLGDRKLQYDRSGEKHYDTISAFIKSMRGSDPDASVYYLARMLSSGEDPRFIARRIVIAASEDVGNADPQALILSSNALRAVEYVGMPEAGIILAQAVIYLATAPKSNASYEALNRAMKYIAENPEEEIPVHLTKKGSKDYRYPHNYPDGYVPQKYTEKKKQFYTPVERGHERLIGKYLSYIKKENEKSSKR